MRLHQERATSVGGNATFDLLRASIEFEAAPPAILAITSAMSEDGREITCRGLAYSLVAAGYTTLYLDTSLVGSSISMSPQRLTLETVASLPIPNAESGRLAMLNLGDLFMQKTTGQRQIQSALQALRRKFDYVIINTDYRGCTAFAEGVVGCADAVFATVKKGRRESPDDARLCAILERFGSRFLGVIALDPAILKIDAASIPVPETVPDWRRSDVVSVDSQNALREVVEWPT